MFDSIDTEVLFETFSLQHLPFEERLVAVVISLLLIAILFIGTSRYWYQFYKKLRKHPDANEVFHGHMSLVHAFHDIIFIFKILLIIYIGIVIRQTVRERPYVAWTNPPVNSRFVTAAPNLKIHFTIPVDKDNITFYTSPEVEGDWVWENTTGGLPLHQEVTFHPKESFYPNTQVVVYMVGLRSAWNNTDSHELALDYSAPRTPRVLGANPDTNAQNVPIDSSIEILYDNPAGEYIDTHIDIQPQVAEYTLIPSEKGQLLSFDEPLRQDQEYTITLYHTPRSYNVLTEEDIKRGDTKKVKEFSFRTVTTPLVNSYEPRGDAVLSDATIRVVFDQEMQYTSVVEHFSITPEISGETNWEDSNIFMFTPDEPFPKDTSISINFSEGIKGIAGGQTEESIELSFKTIGHVMPVTISPPPNSSGIDPASKSISVTFNQEVNQESAQNNFSISPSTNGEFSWNGNTMTYKTTDDLTYDTKYTITLAPDIQTIHGLNSDQEFSYTFTTKSRVFNLTIPYYRQEENFTCNIAATRMALAYRGVVLSENAIQNAIGTGDNPNNSWVPGYGTHIDTIAAYVGQYRNISIKRNWNIPDMLKEVANGNPVIIWEYNRYSQPYGSFTFSNGVTGYNGMHSEVIRGYIGDISNPSHILTNDPWRGRLTYDIATFKSVWGYLNNTALVIY